ncbi:MAG TPA: phage tail protein [Anaerohalosphaeraceae bacterium]|nr:phage tail protein [Anaerohalosphaeraceae bacterium]
MGEGDQALMIGGMLALSLLAPMALGAIAPNLSAAALSGAANASTMMTYSLAKAAIVMGGALALNALVGPGEGSKNASQHYTWEPATTQRVGSFIPLVYGTYGVRGNIICSYATSEITEGTNPFSKESQIEGATDLYWLKIAYSDGPIQGIVEGTERLNDKAPEQYADSDDFVLEHFTGTDDQAASSVPDAFEIPVNQLCDDPTSGDNEVTATFTAVKCDRAAVVLRFPNGFTNYEKDGDHKATNVDVTIRIRESGGTWHTLSDGEIWGNTTKPVRIHRWFNETYDGGSPFTLVAGTTYEVGVTRNNSRHHDHGDDFYFDCIQCAFTTAQKHPGLAYTAIGAAASKDISGAIDYYAKIKGKLVRVYDDATSTWSIEWSDNPAWVAYDVLTRPIIKGNGGAVPYAVESYRRLDPSYLVLDDFVALADWCDTMVSDEAGGTEKRFVFNGVFDEEASTWEQAIRVLRSACAMPYFRGNKIGVVIDKPGTPVQMFNVSNLREGFSETWIDTSEAATVYDAEFYDENADYGAESWPVPLLGAENDIPASLDCFGHTKRSRVWRYASRQLRVNQYMKRMVEIPACLDAIYTNLGDIVYVQHPSLQRATGGRIVAVYADGVKLDKPTELGYYDTGQDPTTYGYHSNTRYGIYFVAKNHLKLGSCVVEAEVGGSLVVRVAKFIPGTGIVGDVLAERTFTVAAGQNKIDLDIVLAPNETGEYYLLYREGTLSLQRGPVSFTPYDFDNIKLVGGGYGVNGTVKAYYYYFFNLEVRNPTTGHALLIRTHDGTAERLTLYEVASVSGEDEDIVTISGTWEYTPNVNDLWTFGEEVRVIDLYRVKGFERFGNGQVLIQAAQYTTDYYTDDEEAPRIEAKTYSQTKGGIAPSLLPTTAQAVAAERLEAVSAVDTLAWEGLAFTGNAVDKVTWTCTGAGIKYKGVWCPIYADAVGTTDKYVYFDPAIGDPRYLQHTSNLADLVGYERYVFCINDGGVAYFQPGRLMTSDDTKLSGLPDSVTQFFYQSSEPTTGMVEGDYWQDSDDKKWYRYSGSAWVDVQDTDILAALNAATTAEAVAVDGRIIIHYSSAPPLVAHYQLNDNAANTTVADASGNGHTGTASRNTSSMTVAGKINSALAFNGTDDYVNIPDHVDLRLTGGGTILAWIKPNSSGETAGRIVDKSTTTTAVNGYAFTIGSNGKLTFQVNGEASISVAEYMTYGEWVHVAVTFDGVRARFYVNGVLVSDQAYTALPPNVAGDVRIGQRAGADDRTFDGAIDDVRIYSRALTRGEILKIYNGGDGTEEVKVPDRGDLWIKSSENNQPYQWTGSAWQAAGYDVATWSKIVGDGKPADNAEVNAPGLGIKINYLSFSTPNNGECYIHGFDEDGEAADVDGWISYCGAKLTVPKASLLTRCVGSGYIVFDTALGTPFTVGGTARNGAFCKKSGGLWYYDNDAQWVQFTPASTYVVIGTLVSDSADHIESAQIWSQAMDLKVVPEANADVTANNPIDTFRETFENPNGDFATRWEPSASVWSIVTETGVAGGNVLRAGDNADNDRLNIHYFKHIAFDPSKLYRCKVRVRRTAGTGTFYFGIDGYLSDNVTLNVPSGNSSHWIVAHAANPGSDWITYTGYFKGLSTGEGDCTVHADPSDPAQLKAGTAYIGFRAFINYSAAAGITDIDEIVLDILPEDADQIPEGSTNKFAAESGADVTAVHATSILFRQDTEPADPQEGWTWWDTSGDPVLIKRYDGSEWVTVGVDIQHWLHDVDQTKLDGQHIYPQSVTTDKLAANSVTASKILVDMLSAITQYVGTLVGGSITGSEIIGGIIKTATSGRYVQIDEEGIKFFMAATAGLFGTTANGGSNLKYGTSGSGGSGATYGSGMLARFYNMGNGLPFDVVSEQTSVGDMHLFPRSSDPTTGKPGDIALVNNKLRVCTSTTPTWQDL